MSALRLIAVAAVIALSIPLAIHLANGAAHQLATLPHAAPTVSPAAGPRRPVRHAAQRHRPRHRSRVQRPAAAPARHPTATAGALLDPQVRRLLVLAGLETAGGLLLSAAAIGAVTTRRLRRRRSRHYELYELRLSTHDQAKPQDLEDLFEAIAHLVRAFPVERARHGQPHVAVELICLPDPDRGDAGDVEWSLNLRCEPAIVDALDAAIASAYPDVRLGRTAGEAPESRPPPFAAPRHVMRFRKQRGFVYPLIAPDETLASPPLEQIALAQVGLGAPSVVRFQLTPAPGWFEALARRLYRRHENRLVRAERWGLPEGGLTSTLNRTEMRAAEQTQNRSLFWLELTVAADTRSGAKAIAAALQARRGENRLHRRHMLARRRLYRRRFPRALAPLIPSPRSLISAAEAAHLLELPSARMKGVPVRRATVPRIPAPPDALRADDLGPIAIPSASPPAPAVPERDSLAAAA